MSTSATVPETTVHDARTDWSLSTDRRAWKPVVIAGLLFAFAALYLTLVGLVNTFHERDLIEDVMSLGQAMLLVTFAFGGYVGATRAPKGPLNANEQT